MIARLLAFLRRRLDARIDAHAKAALAAYGTGDEHRAQHYVTQVRRAQARRAALCCDHNCDQGRQCPAQSDFSTTT